MNGQARVRPPHAAHETARVRQPWKGLGGLFALSVIVAPMVAFSAPVGGPTILDDGSLVPLGVVIALIIAVFHAGQQMQKLTDKLQGFDKLEARVTVLEARADDAEEAAAEAAAE